MIHATPARARGALRMPSRGPSPALPMALVFSLSLALVLSLSLARPSAAAEEDAGRWAESVPVKVHFVVVGGMDPARDMAVLGKFKDRLVELAGGFTELGRTSGGSTSSGHDNRKANYSFLVAADRDVADEIRAMTLELFHDEAFVLVWDAERKGD